MKIDVLGLLAFLTIAERGSFHAAASHLNLSQTALSHRIRKLEEGVATQLLVRTTRQVSLTAAGMALLPHARRAFAEIDAALAEMRAADAAPEQRLAIACLPTIAMICLPDAVARFSRDHPAVRLRVHDNSASEIAEKVHAGEVEIGVTIVAANARDLELKPIVKEPFVLVCRRDMPLADAAALTWAQLQGLPLVRICAETGNRVLIDDALGSRREAMFWRYEVERVTTAVSLVRSGAGYTIVPQLAYNLAGAPELVAIPLRSPSVSRTLGIVSRKGAPLSAPARALAKILAQVLKASVRAEAAAG
jgi:DNA-binding transcriptional LysR family regulator